MDIARPIITIVQEHEESCSLKHAHYSDRPLATKMRMLLKKKNTDRRIGNMIATGTVDALPQFDPFHTIRPIRNACATRACK
jgi:hypothetical protein